MDETMSLLGHLAAIATPVALVAGWLRIEKKIRDECAMVRREAEKAHVRIGERILPQHRQRAISDPERISPIEANCRHRWARRCSSAAIDSSGMVGLLQ